MADEYRTSIPVVADEHVTETYPGGRKRRAEYLLDGVVVGIRTFFVTGDVEDEWALAGGVYHGMHYRWDEHGKLLSAIPYHEGREHGTARQWLLDGAFVGTYTMEHGTGLDLCWQERHDDGEVGGVYLAEASYRRNGKPHGFEWWINPDQLSVSAERHWRGGELHGVERAWNDRGRLRRGFPRYWLAGERVTKARYLEAWVMGGGGPPFRPADNLPARAFPPEVARHLRLPDGGVAPIARYQFIIGGGSRGAGSEPGSGGEAGRGPVGAVGSGRGDARRDRGGVRGAAGRGRARANPRAARAAGGGRGGVGGHAAGER